MAIGTGMALVVAAKKATTWGTAVAVGALSGFRPLTWSAERVGDELADKSYNGDAYNRQSNIIGKKHVSGKFSFWLTYEGCQQRIIALGLGTATVSGSNPYVHYSYRINDTTGIFGTLCWFDGVVTWEVDSFKITDMSFSCEPGGVVTVEVSWIGRDCMPNTATNANLSTVTETAVIDYVQWLNSTTNFKLIAQLGALTTCEINKWKVDYHRTFPTDDRAWSSNGGEFMREIAGGEATTSVDIQVPYADTARIVSAYTATIEEMELLINAGSAKQWGWWLPSVKWTKSTYNPTDKSEIPLQLTGVCEKALAVPTGYIATYGVVPYVQFTNTVATAALS